jgi:hypothetical protein
MHEYRYSSVFSDLTSVRTLNLTQQEMLKLQQAFNTLKTLVLIPRNAKEGQEGR